MGPEIYERSS